MPDGNDRPEMIDGFEWSCFDCKACAAAVVVYRLTPPGEAERS